MTTTGKSLSIIGFGAFGRFMAPHLRERFDVLASDREDISTLAAAAGIPWSDLAGAAKSDFIVLAVPVQNLGEVLSAIAPHIRPTALVIDVCSVKLVPIQMMLAALPPSAGIIGLHPLFGPQSGKDGIAGLPIALCPARAEEHTIDEVREFLADGLKLNVIRTTPDEHDREMAYVQALTHFVSRAVGSLDLPQTPMATRAYRRFLEMKADLQNDSMELFLTIERFNPYAADVRGRLILMLNELEQAIGAAQQSPGP